MMTSYAPPLMSVFRGGRGRRWGWGRGGGGEGRGREARILGGKQWHLDGMDKGLYGPFSLLIGIALSDQTVDNCGNLGVHPGSHHTLAPFLKEYAAVCDHRGLDTSVEEVVQARRMQAVELLQRKPVLGEPVQVHLSKGDVVIALHKLAHLGTPNYSEHVRKMVYFRVSHRHLDKLRWESLDNMWVEYEGMQEVL
jgi:ectoine hydroxylase-related dioxygenase (phytanoyl-CoA dioxygenase family)